MKNIFEVIDSKFFQVFAGENRRIHAEIIMVIGDYFKRGNSSFVDKEDIVNYLADYISHRGFDKMYDEDGNDISTSTPREKAQDKLNLFKKNGWILYEIGENYTDLVQIDENALIMLKAMEEMGDNAAPKEYTGYIYVIDSLLRDFDYSQATSILERIFETTETLMIRLRGLNSSIKKYLSRLLRDDEEDASKLLNTLLGDYQENVINKAFNNLKLSDNPSKYKNRILNKLSELRSADGVSKLIANYRLTKSSKESDDEIEGKLLQQIDFVYDNIELLQQTISMIDVKNSKYVKSSTGKLSFILSENYDVEGKIKNILKQMKMVKGEKATSDAFGLYSMKTIDSDSPYQPRTDRKTMAELPVVKVPEIDQNYVNRVMNNLFKADLYSKRAINEYVKSLLHGKPSFRASDLSQASFDDFTRLILIQIYSHHEGMCYETVPNDEMVKKHQFEYADFTINRKGDRNGR